LAEVDLLSLLLWFESIMMKELPHPKALQDSIPVKNIPAGDSVTLRPDTLLLFNTNSSKDSLRHRVKSQEAKLLPAVYDTISVCSRNSIEDVTFYDSCNLLTRIYPVHTDKFPFLFTLKNKQIQVEAKSSLVKHLRDGTDIPLSLLHDDWMIILIVTIAYLFAIVRKSSDNILQGVQRFFLFRGINDASSRDLGALFSWESTAKNLMSFIVLALFGYLAASYYNAIPSSVNRFLFWLILVFAIITAVSLRHLICLVTGAISDQREVFQEYLLSIYQFYRFSALLVFVVSILISYSTIFPLKSSFTAGVVILATLYLIRVLRLFIIFINKNISLFYLILYLCALEILPVVITVKYFSGTA
jgi:hypothetical protein